MKIIVKFLCKKISICVLFSMFLILGFIYEGNNNKLLHDYEKISNEIIVIFNENKDSEELALFMEDLPVAAEIIRHIEDYALLSVENSQNSILLIEQLKKHKEVKAVQENYEISFLSSQDSYTETQWAIHNPGSYLHISPSMRYEAMSVEGIDMDVVGAWQHMNKEGHELREVVVAVIDTGVDYLHPDLAENMWVNPKEIPNSGIDDDGNGYIDDIHGWDFYNNNPIVCSYNYDPIIQKYVASLEDNDNHGTHIAGIIAAVANNQLGIAGVASNVNVKIMALKINGGPNGAGTVSNAIEAIKYATMMGADIANISWGTSQYSEALEIVIRESDMLFVTAAGNAASNNNSKPVYPASFDLDNIISVAYINAMGKVASASNYGTLTVDIAAPGENIFSTIVGGYATMSGSSMAAPHVSAVAAMLYTFSDNLYPSNVKEIIINNIKPISGLENYVKYPGIPSALETVKAAVYLLEDQYSPELYIETISNKEEYVLLIDGWDQGGAGIRVIRWLYGEREMEEFRRGTVGTRVVNNQVTLHQVGMYSFYVSDYAGNEKVIHYKIEDNKIPSNNMDYVLQEEKPSMIPVQVKEQRRDLVIGKYLQGERIARSLIPADDGREHTFSGNRVSLEQFNFRPSLSFNNLTEHAAYSLNTNKSGAMIKLLDREKIVKLGKRFITAQTCFRTCIRISSRTYVD